MSNRSSGPRITYFRRLSQAASLLVLAVSVLATYGWLAHNAAIRNWLPGLSPYSAFVFMLVALALLFVTWQEHSLTARVLAWLVAVSALVRLAELFFGITLERSVIFGYQVTSADLMAPYTAIAILELAIAILLLNTRSHRLFSFGQIFAIAAAALAALMLTGHFYNFPSLYKLGDYPPVSYATGCLLFFLGAGLLVARIDQGITRILISQSLGGSMARRLLPLAVAVPTVLTGLQVILGRASLFGDETDAIVFAAITTTVIVGIIWWNAGTLNAMERARNQAEASLRASEARYRALFENSTDAIMIFDERGHYFDANPQAESLLGYSREEIITHSVGEFAALPIHGQAAATEIRRTGHLRVDYVVARKDGSQVDVEFLVTPISPGLYQTILHDISERKHVEASLRTSLEQERQLNEMKARFVSMVSHDFRSPLAVIRSATDLLINYSDRMDAIKRRSRLEKIQTQVSHLVELLDDILAIGRAETLGDNFHPEPVDLQVYCQALIAEIQPATPSHHIQFSYTGADELVEVDPKLLRRALVNLLTNAVKYSPGCDQVRLDVACTEAEITLRVQDEGIGIPEADQAHLFEVFHRASNVGDISGTGLGLPIVRQVAEAHGGSVHCISQVNSGTTFTITLPRQRA